jgi:hypothetical protein
MATILRNLKKNKINEHKICRYLENKKFNAVKVLKLLKRFEENYALKEIISIGKITEYVYVCKNSRKYIPNFEISVIDGIVEDVFYLPF